MTIAEAFVVSDAPLARIETPVPGGVVITIGTIKGHRYRARNEMGVMLRDGRTIRESNSFSEAADWLAPVSVATLVPPAKPTRCSHCRGRHSVDVCPVMALEAERIRKASADREAEKEAMQKDPHTLDEYLSAVRSIDGGTGRGATMLDVKRNIWGNATGKRATEFALAELVEQGKLRKRESRYVVAEFPDVVFQTEATAGCQSGGCPCELYTPDCPDPPDVALAKALSLHAEEIHGTMSEEEIAEMRAARPDGEEEDDEEDPPPSDQPAKPEADPECPVTGGKCEIAETACHDCIRGKCEEPGTPSRQSVIDSAVWAAREAVGERLRTLDDVAAKHTGPFAVIAREKRLSETKSERIVELEVAWRELTEAAELAAKLIAELMAS